MLRWWILHAQATLLGSPLGNGRSVSKAIDEKISALKKVGEKFDQGSVGPLFIVIAQEHFSNPKDVVSAANSPLLQVQAVGSVE